MILRPGRSSAVCIRLLEVISHSWRGPSEPRRRVWLPWARLIAATILALGACGRPQQSLPSGVPASYLYTCPDSYRFGVRILNDSAVLELSGRTQTLPQVVAASGVKYQQGNVVFWTKGDTARLEIGSTVHHACAGVRADVSRQRMRLRGMETP